MRKSISVRFPSHFILKNLVHFLAEREFSILLNSNSNFNLTNDKYSKCNLLIAVDSLELISPDKNYFEELNLFSEKNNDWLFGYFSYDLKNQLENLSSANNDELGFPDMIFFRPRYVLNINEGKIQIYYLEEADDENSVIDFLNKIFTYSANDSEDENVELKSRISKEQYFKNIKHIKENIKLGNIYEMNYCMEFYSENVKVNPADLYSRLNEISPMPFSAFVKLNHLYAACASPERFIAKRGNKIISQPIKGTIRRGKNPEEDQQLIEKLKSSEKERSENIMIVDLVRNDLSRTAAKESVKVEELCEIYSFNQLHQMISTVVSELKDHISPVEAIRNAFPMGSMTGAPKISAMNLIEKFEVTKRGLYSGSIGYFSPDGDFDFNVVIRSILYNEEKKYLSYMVGSAITDGSLAEQEYEECLLKGKSMQKICQFIVNEPA